MFLSVGRNLLIQISTTKTIGIFFKLFIQEMYLRCRPEGVKQVRAEKSIIEKLFSVKENAWK